MNPMTIFQLLKGHGLIHVLTNTRVMWFESMASEVTVDLIDDNGNTIEDFRVIVASFIEDDDYIIFNSDAPVEDAGIDGEQFVIIQSCDGVRRVFNVYKVLSFDEIVLEVDNTTQSA
jgi:hypothetical protein